LLSGVRLGTFVEELEFVELWWFGSVSSDLEFDVVLPVLISLGVLILDPLHIGGANFFVSSLFTYGLTDLGKGISGNKGWVLKTDIVTMRIDTLTTSWIFGDELFVGVHGRRNVFIGKVVDVAADTDLVSWNWGTKVTTSLLMSLLVGRSDEIVVVHDIVPEGKFHIAEKLQDSLEIFLGDPASHVGKV